MKKVLFIALMFLFSLSCDIASPESIGRLEKVMTELENIEYVDGMMRLFINDTVHQEVIIVEISAEDFFKLIANAFKVE